MTTEPHCVDWESVIGDLRKQGTTFRSIAEFVSVSTSTVVDWAYSGRQPRHADGERLIELWQQVTTHVRAQLPLVVPSTSAGYVRP